MLKVWTATYRYPGPYRLDITVKGNDPVGHFFAPTWDMVKNHKKTDDNAAYIAAYHKMMLASYANNRNVWEELLSRENVVLVCFCPYGQFCHRFLLAEYLKQLGATYMGEITDFSQWQKTSANKTINVYSKSEDELGRLLSNFAHTPFIHNNMQFQSVEGWWYWYATGCVHNHLATLCGAAAKFEGRKFERINTITKELLAEVYKAKLAHNPHIKNMLINFTGTFEHYYMFGGKKVPADKYLWTVKLWEEIRTEINL